MKKKRQKKTSFSTALADAEKRLAKALQERTAAQTAVAELNREIPSLQRTIDALKGVMPSVPVTGKGIPAVTGEHRAETSAVVPSKTMKVTRDGIEYEVPLPVEDVSGMGALPLNKNDELPTRELTEDDLLNLGDVK